MGAPVAGNAVSDTGPPLHLTEVEQADALAVFGVIHITLQVRDELARHGVLADVAAALGRRLIDESVTQEEAAAAASSVADYALHPADVSVVALAERIRPTVVLTDDLSLRRAIESLGRTVTGSIGVLVRAFRAGMLSRADLEWSLDRLMNGSTLYLSPGLRAHVRSLIDDLAGSGRKPPGT